MRSATAYEELLKRSQRILDFEKVDHLLHWDADVMMPVDGAAPRTSQRQSVAAARYDALTDDRLGDLLDELDGATLTDEQAANVRELRRAYEITTSVPAGLNDELNRATAEAHEAWKVAKSAGDFDEFAPALARHVDLRREWADAVAPERDPFEVLWAEQTGYLQNRVSLSTVEAILDDLRDALPPLIEAIADSDVSLDLGPFEGTYDPTVQRQLSRDALDALELDWDRTRFDLAPHPFSYGTQYDVRMTSRFDERDPFDGLSSTLHEFGHTAYSHGLPREHYGTPLGEPRDVSVHESQSRFFENHVGRTRAFWEFFLPLMADRFPRHENATPERAYQAVNRVDPENCIRVEADELTYHMHILVRHEIASDLVSGALTAEGVPAAWNEKMDDYLGVTPETPVQGALQDPHWAARIPAFATYTIGSVFAAQLRHAMADDLDVDDQIRHGAFEPIREWLTTHVHQHGRRYPANELIRRATGEELTAEYFLEYVTEKYEDLYDL